jgi:hypothetical protein
MSVIASACGRILACLKEVSPVDAQGFQLGLSRVEIEEGTRELLFSLPQEIYELYQWRDGNPWSNRFIFSNYWMLSLKNALDAYCLRGSFADIRDLYFNCDDRESKDDNYFWNRHWFPIFRGRDEHRFWAVNIGKESSPILDIAPGEHCIELYPSLTEMLTAEAECFEKVIELIDGRNCAPCDINLYPDDSRLTDIRRRYGYKLDCF